LPAYTVLITCIASIGKNAILKTEGGCNQQINAIIPNTNNCAEFLYYIFESSKQFLLSNAGTTATSIISKAVFSEMTYKRFFGNSPAIPGQYFNYINHAVEMSHQKHDVACAEHRLECS